MFFLHLVLGIQEKDKGGKEKEKSEDSGRFPSHPLLILKSEVGSCEPNEIGDAQGVKMVEDTGGTSADSVDTLKPSNYESKF